MQKAKELAVKILSYYDKQHLSLKKAFSLVVKDSKYPLELRRTAFHYSIEIIRYLNSIDFILRKVVPIPLKDLPSPYKNILRLATFEYKFEKNATPNSISEYITLIKRVINDQEIINQSKEVLEKIKSFNLIRYIKRLDTYNKLALAYSHPVWFIKKVAKLFDRDDLVQLLHTNNTPRPFWLRVNTLKCSVDYVLSSLKEEGIIVKQDKNYPIMLRVIKNKIPLPLSKAVTTGYAFIQDKASVLTIYALNPSENDIIWDACAAPGMKTVTISQFMKNQGLILATDYSLNRLRIAIENVKKAGAHNIEFIAANAKKVSINSHIDKVLIDAPCSSSGVFQSDPEFKWRVTLKKLNTLVSTQRKILKGVLRNLDEGTVVVYVTCSILPDEGEEQILWLLNNYDIELLPLNIEGNPGYPNYWFSKFVRRTYPFSNETKGFFISKFVYFGKK